MARINFTKTVVAGVVGVADSVLEDWDARTARTEAFRNAADLSRAGLAIGANLAILWDMWPELAEPVAYAEDALLAKSIYRAVKPAVLGARSVQEVIAGTAVRRLAGGGLGGYPGPMTQKEFEGVRLS